jgi:hypothetical protein
VQLPEDDDTSAHRLVVCEALPEVPVTVIWYAPAVVEEVVVALNAEVWAVVLLMVTEAGERLQVVGLVAPVGELVTEHVSATVPVNELAGVTVIVDVPVAPGITVMLPPLERVKLVLLGASQKPLHPASSGAAPSSTHAHFPIFITAPLLFRLMRRLKGIASGPGVALLEKSCRWRLSAGRKLITTNE